MHDLVSCYSIRLLVREYLVLVELGRALDQYDLNSSFTRNDKKSQTISKWGVDFCLWAANSKTLLIDFHYILKQFLKIIESSYEGDQGLGISSRSL